MVPDSVRLRFPHVESLQPKRHQGFVIGRLLEEGDRNELRWLFATAGREAVVDWWREFGGRQLSARSRAFWSPVLGPTRGAEPLAAQLWPLA